MKDLKERWTKGQRLQRRRGQGGGQPGNSKEFATNGRKQAALRNALRELQKEKQEQGKGDKALDEIMDGMNKIETDLVNKRLTNEMLKRQQEQILTRLLEHEKAEREREQDDQRQAETAASNNLKCRRHSKNT
jgi:hypothetical protein